MACQPFICIYLTFIISTEYSGTLEVFTKRPYCRCNMRWIRESLYIRSECIRMERVLTLL